MPATMPLSVAPLRRLTIVGVGLIGGSFALGLKAAGLVREVVGVGRTQANLDTALELGILDHATTSLAQGVEGSELVLLSTPVGQMGDLFRQLRQLLPPGAVLTDGGSTKSDVVALARSHLGERLADFVPGHPIAGAEFSGASAARADLYRQKQVVLTPLPESSPEAVARVRQLWQACGALVPEMSPAQHDRIFAAVSHLPHLLSFALVEELARRPDGEVFFQYAASGFRDFTRIASSHPEMWRDISLANREALIQELEAYQAQLLRLHQMLLKQDAAGLEAVFATSRQARNAWLEKKKQALHPLTDAASSNRIAGNEVLDGKS